MKIILSIFLFLFSMTLVNAQDMTIILVRHAEKDSSKYDPVLTPEGQQRAIKFYELVKKYKPEQIFSTGYKRTRFTAEPLAVNQNEKYRMFVESYDGSELETFANKLLGLRTKTIVVIGHSNTTPKLANLLLKQEKYKDMAESEYGKIFIIRIKGKKVTDEVIEY